jgi:myo-inositol-1(or 4)-monophosphatase
MDRIEVMKRAARKAGEFMRDAGQKFTEHTDKTNARDFVTQADLKSQEIIANELRSAFPDVVVLSEEDDESARAAMYKPQFTGFVVDPIDGTYSFKHDMGESSVSIGYIEDGEPIAGVIYNPYRDEMFEAVKGRGAKLNGKPIRVSNTGDIEGASIATSNGYDADGLVRNLRRQIAIFEQSGKMPWLSCPGSSVLAMAHIACGRVDALHHNFLKPWDNAAAFLIVREAGGEVRKLGGGEAHFTDSAFVVGNPQMVTALQEIFGKIDRKLLR